MTTTIESPVTITTSDDVEVRLVSAVGNDASIIAAARVSTQGPESLESLQQDAEGSRGLIRYLMKNRHGSPFEHAQLTFFIQGPIFAFREFHRHRTGWSYNEESGRYKEMDAHFYRFGPQRKLRQVGKAGHYEFVHGEDAVEDHVWLDAELMEHYEHCYRVYQRILERGIAREVARAALPFGIFSSMYATCNPRSLMHFLSLRTKVEGSTFPSFPQREIEMIAEKMEQQFALRFPLTYEAFCDFGRVAP